MGKHLPLPCRGAVKRWRTKEGKRAVKKVKEKQAESNLNKGARGPTVRLRWYWCKPAKQGNRENDTNRKYFLNKQNKDATEIRKQFGLQRINTNQAVLGWSCDPASGLCGTKTPILTPLCEWSPEQWTSSPLWSNELIWRGFPFYLGSHENCILLFFLCVFFYQVLLENELALLHLVQLKSCKLRRPQSSCNFSYFYKVTSWESTCCCLPRKQLPAYCCCSFGLWSTWTSQQCPSGWQWQRQEMVRRPRSFKWSATSAIYFFFKLSCQIDGEAVKEDRGFVHTFLSGPLLITVVGLGKDVQLI